MLGLLTGADPGSLLDVQASLLADEPIAHGQDWAARDVMFYDRMARKGFAGFTFAECDELQALRVREEKLRDVCMTKAARERHSFMVFSAQFFPLR